MVDEIRPISSLFHTLRSDIAIICKDTIEILELTVCHETNFTHSKIFKVNKYKDKLKDCLNDNYKHLKLLIKYTLSKFLQYAFLTSLVYHQLILFGLTPYAWLTCVTE